MHGYSLLRADHPSNTKRGGICIYCKETLVPKVKSTPYFNESLLCKVTVGSRKCIIGSVYRSPSQNSDEFESCLLNFDITTTEGIQLETTTTIYGSQQLIDESTNQPNLIINRGTYSLHENCQHEITFT